MMSFAIFILLFCSSLSWFPSDDSCHLWTEDFAVDVIDETEVVAVVRSAHIVPDPLGEVVFSADCDDVAHVVLAVFEPDVSYRAKLAEPEDLVRMLCSEIKSREHDHAQVVPVDFCDAVVNMFVAAHDSMEVPVSLHVIVS